MTELRTTNSIRSELGIVLLLAVSVAVVYWQVVNHQFVRYDDDKYITDNSYVQQGFTSESVVWAFTTGHASNWHPLTWLSHMADYELFGLHPAGHLLMNVFLHLLNSIVLFLLLRSMTGALWQSAFVAALFALHPLHVESVAWAAERKDTLSALFWFVATWAYLHYARKPTIARITGVAVLLGLGLMAKPMLVTLPFTFLLLDFWPLDRLGILGTDARPKWSEIKPNVGNLLWEKLPLFTLVAISSNITYTVQQRGGAMSGEDSIAFTVRVANALVSYVEYVRMMVWPSGLAVFYPHFGETIPSWQVVGGAVLLCGITAVALRYGRQRPYLSVGWFWYVGTLLPVIGFVQVGAQAMADRYTYIPLVGLFIIVAWGAADVSTRWRKRGSILAFSSACVLVALMVVAWQQVG
ncbi:MAG: glycosyltransferase family 39 protein, partial [Bacteroidota bacterium]